MNQTTSESKNVFPLDLILTADGFTPELSPSALSLYTAAEETISSLLN